VRGQLLVAIASLQASSGDALHPSVFDDLSTLNDLIGAAAAPATGLTKQVDDLRTQIGSIGDDVCDLAGDVGDAADIDQQLSDLRDRLDGEQCGDTPPTEADAHNLDSNVEAVRARIADLLSDLSTALTDARATAIPALVAELDEHLSQLDPAQDGSLAKALADVSTQLGTVLTKLGAGAATTTDADEVLAEAAAAITEAQRVTGKGIDISTAIEGTFGDELAAAKSELGIDGAPSSACSNEASTKPFVQMYNALKQLLGCTDGGEGNPATNGKDDEIAASLDAVLRGTGDGSGCGQPEDARGVVNELVCAGETLEQDASAKTGAIREDASTRLTTTQQELQDLAKKIQAAVAALEAQTEATVGATTKELGDQVKRVYRALTGSDNPTLNANELARGGFQLQLLNQLTEMSKQEQEAGLQSRASDSFRGLRRQALFGQATRNLAQAEGSSRAAGYKLFSGTAQPGTRVTTVFLFHLAPIG
jgi:hypothetical protein